MRFLAFAAVLIAFAPNSFAQYDCWRDESPIVVHLGTGGYQLTGAESPVLFDIRATGQPVLMGWTAAGANDAFLCLDRNNSGSIESGAELFGNAVLLPDGTKATNGFIALAQSDDNGDGIIDQGDGVWPHLLLWRDLDHDGVSQPSELTPVAGSAMTAISLDYHWTGRRDSSGNTFRFESQVWLAGKASHATPRPVYDIFFVTVRSQ